MRFRTFATAALILVLAVASGTIATPRPAAAAPTGYQLRWSDEFDGTTVDTAKWSYRTDSPWQAWSQQRAENVAVGGGAMTITLCPANRAGSACDKPVDAGDRFTGGGLISKARLRYGYYETRARTNVGSGWHSAFWAAQAGGTGARTEIDGFEIDSHVPSEISHNIIGWDQGVRLSSGFRDDLGFDTSAAWHVYGFEWTEAGVRIYVDGVLYDKWLPSYPQSEYAHDYLNLWLSTIAVDLNNSPGVDVSALPGKVQFDYARYYQRDAYGDNDDPAGGYAETGTGWAASSLPSFARQTNRYNCASAATARWTVTPPVSGNYRAYFHRVGADGGQPDAPVALRDGGTTLAATSVDLSVAGNAWLPIGGSVALTGGHAYTIGIDRTGSGCIRADAVKLVRQ
ncbi:family 16 glycosylhydrolase [Microlunatus sp. GCM10028923]|uniref:family 16 glycosylhydrolase n=1 Tax=Microlunatus sp. GCM10028923 TaxID=3273400 RepID=UPI00361A339E